MDITRPFDGDWSWSRTVLVVLIVAGVITVAVTGSTTSASFGAYNPGWDGSSSVRNVGESTGVPVEIVTEPTAYTRAPSGTTVAMAIAPSDEYTDEDLAQIRSFVRRGGTLLVAEDVGSGGNLLLEGVGADTRFDGRLVRDLRHNGPNSDMPVATEVSSDPLTRGVESVMLNNGTILVAPNETGALTPLGSPNSTADASVLVATSSFSSIDRDRDGDLSDEQLRSYPVVAVEQIGNGRVIAVSDPSVFINSMQDRASNRALLTAIVVAHERVLLDYSYAAEQPPLRLALLWLRRTPAALAGLGGVALLTLELLVRRKIFIDSQ